MERPDIASAVRAVARYAQSPAARHWKAVRRIIVYLKATKDLGVVFRRGGDLKLSLFADADYADRCNDRRWVSGAAFMLENTAVNASSTTQHCVTLSTSEAEYVAMAHGSKTVLAIKAVLDFVQPYLSGGAIDMFEDNKGAKTLAENPQGSHCSKHIDVRFHFLRGFVRLGQVTIHSVASVDQHADIFTKPLGREAFRRHRDFFMNLSWRFLLVGCECVVDFKFLVLSLYRLARFHWLVDVAKQGGCSIYVLLTSVTPSW